MKRLSRTWSVLLLALVASNVWSSPWAPSLAAAQPAKAAPADDAKRTIARELANKGFEHYEAGEYAKAIQYFRDAEAHFHAPTLLIVQANAYVKIGGLVEARTLYQRVASEELGSDAPKEFLKAQSDAKEAIAGLSARIATLKIVLKGMTPEKVHITIDDVEVPTDQVLQPIPQNPGTHKIVAAIGGDASGRAVFQSVTLKEGTTKQIQLVFRAGDPPPKLPPAGGCASCEIAAPRGGAGLPVPEGLLATVVVGLLSTFRRCTRPTRKPPA